MSSNALYSDLSSYYDLMCADINYQQQSDHVHRLQQIFGNQGKNMLDLACGTGLHVQHFVSLAYQAIGLDISQNMLELAKKNCPQAHFIQQDMSNFKVEEPLDLITCFLYSLHYSDGIDKLKNCIASAYAALTTGGVFCFNAVDKNSIDNSLSIRHTTVYNNSDFVFTSAWNYPGHGAKQTINLTIEKKDQQNTQYWQENHPMVAVTFQELQTLLSPYFDVHIFEHIHDKIIPWEQLSGNAIFVCVKK